MVKEKQNISKEVILLQEMSSGLLFYFERIVAVTILNNVQMSKIMITVRQNLKWDDNRLHIFLAQKYQN